MARRGGHPARLRVRDAVRRARAWQVRRRAAVRSRQSGRAGPMKPLVLALLLFAPAIAYGTEIVSSEFVTGKPLPIIDIIDDAGRVRSTSDWKGIPTIIAPMYARCPVACPLIASALKRGVAQSSAAPSTYRVVLFSFDPHDTPADLRHFREREGIPLAWTVAAAAHPGDARAAPPRRRPRPPPAACSTPSDTTTAKSAATSRIPTKSSR